jgi:hypothetical protein
MVGGMVSPTEVEMDIPIKIRTKEKLTIYVVWEVVADTNTRIIEVNGAMKHVPEDTDNDTAPKGLIGRMREAELVLLGAVQPKDYVLDAVFAPKNSVMIVEDTKRTRCGVVTENHAIASENYIIENVSEIPCPLTKELMETAIHLKALGYRLNAFTYKYDLMILTILMKNNLIQLG